MSDGGGVFDSGSGDAGMFDSAVDGGSDSGLDGSADAMIDAGTIVEPEGATPIANSRAFLFYDITEDGRYVAFASPATNLVADDTNGVADVFRV